MTQKYLCDSCENYLYDKNEETGNVFELCKISNDVRHEFRKKEKCDSYEPVTSRQNPYDKVSHGCHTGYDKLSHGSCFNCIHCDMLEEDFGMFCHHDDIRSDGLPISDCPLWEKDDGSTSR